jgi:hypothetical protein
MALVSGSSAVLDEGVSTPMRTGRDIEHSTARGTGQSPVWRQFPGN